MISLPQENILYVLEKNMCFVAVGENVPHVAGNAVQFPVQVKSSVFLWIFSVVILIVPKNRILLDLSIFPLNCLFLPYVFSYFLLSENIFDSMFLVD